MQTQIQKNNHFFNAVSQLDKMYFPTLKTATGLSSELGRQERKNVHTPTHTKKLFYQQQSQQRIKLIEDYVFHINFFNADVYVDCGFDTFKNSIFTAAPLGYQNLFYDLVCAITKVNKLYREVVNSKLLSEAIDYTEAIKILTWAIEPLEKCYPDAYRLVLQTIAEKYSKKNFQAPQIAKRIGYSTQGVLKILHELLKENKVEKISGRTWVGRAYKPCLFFKYKVSY